MGQFNRGLVNFWGGEGELNCGIGKFLFGMGRFAQGLGKFLERVGRLDLVLGIFHVEVGKFSVIHDAGHFHILATSINAQRTLARLLKSVQSTLSHLISTSVPRATFTRFFVKHGLFQYY